MNWPPAQSAGVPTPAKSDQAAARAAIKSDADDTRGSGPNPARVEHPSFDTRLYVGAAFLALLAIAIAVITGLSWSMPVADLWMMALLVAVMLVQSRFRIDTDSATRRTTEALWAAPITVALFWMEPWPLIIAVLGGFAAGWSVVPEMKMRWRVYNLCAQFLVSVCVVRVVVWIDADNALDVPRSVLVAVAVWAVADVVRLVPYFAMSWARWGTFRFDLVLSTFSATRTRATAAAVGLVIAAVLEESPWLLAPLVPLMILLYRSGANANRVSALQAGIEQLSELSAATAAATDLGEIDRALLRAIRAVGGTAAASIARPADTDEPKGAVAWDAPLDAKFRAELHTLADLHARAQTKPAPVADAAAVGVWLVDPVRSCYLVVVTDGVNRLKDYWVIIGHLAGNARLAMANARQQVALVEVAEREYWRARTDESTGLPNEYAARVELDRRLETGVTTPFGVVAVSLLGYKQLVDVLGKDRGDAAIAAFAQRLGNVAGVEFLARIGRSEFALVATGGVIELSGLAERARQVEVQGEENALALRDASAGVAVAYPNQMISGEELLSRATLALDQAEGSGDVVVFGDAELAAEERRVAIRLSLSDALAQRELWPAFQPQIDLRTGAVAGLEVLARWMSPELGFVSPGEFIGVAEQSNQIERLTISMLEQALDAHRVWTGEGATFPISVNLSAESLRRPRFLARLVGTVKDSGLAAELLTMEITESTLVESAETVAALATLADLGVRISIDDFGTGFSSLSYLERLPVHELKIDRSMVMPLEQRTTISPVLRWLTRMSQDLGYAVVAEGIETETQLQALQTLSIDIGQGYLFAKPMSGDAITTWLRTYEPSGLVVGPDVIRLSRSFGS